MFLPIYLLIYSIKAKKLDCDDITGKIVIDTDALQGLDTYDDCTIPNLEFEFSDVKTKAIPANLFSNCRIGTLKIPEEATEIRRNSFYDCKIDTIDFGSDSKLTKILSQAFYNVKPYISSYTTLTLPDKVTEIGESAFDSSSSFSSNSLDFTIDPEKSSLMTIGNQAFKNVRFYSSSLTLPTALKTIGNSAFKSTNIYSLTFQEDSELTSIGEESFSEISSLSSINRFHYATKLTEIKNNAFYNSGQSSLSFYLPKSLNEIGDNAFTNGYTNRIYLNTEALLQKIGKEAFKENSLSQYYIDSDGTTQIQSINSEHPLIFTDSLTDIGEAAFKNLQGKVITIEFDRATNLVNIGDEAFYKISFEEHSKLNLNSESIKLIGSRAFYLNNNFERTFTIKSLNKLEKIGDDPFKNQIVNYPDTIDFPAGLNYIGDNAFNRQPKSSDPLQYHSKSISKITFQQTNVIEKIGDFAFQNQDKLEVTGNIKAHKIGDRSFEYCANLNTNIEIEPDDKVAGSIGDYTFYNCINFAGSLTMKNPAPSEDTTNPSLSSIGEASFQNTGLRKINLPHMEIIGPNAFQNCIQLEADSKDLEIDTISGSAFKDCTSLVLSSITSKSIKSNAFENCHKLKANIVVLNGGNIGDDAFHCCNDLGTLTYDRSFITDEVKVKAEKISQEAFYKSGVTGPLTIPFFINQIGQKAFANCDKIDELIIESNLEIKQAIEEKAFYYATIKKALVIPRSVGLIGDKAFAFTEIPSLEIQGSKYLEPVNGVPTPIGVDVKSNAFYFCKELKTVKLGDGYIDINSNSFKGCPIETIDLGQIEKIPDEAFYGITTLSKVTIPDNVTEIGQRAFAECSGINTILFNPNSHLKTIKKEAFYKCSKLATTSIPKHVTTINERTYYKCFELPLIKIPQEVTEIKEFAFYQCGKFSGNLVLPSELTFIGESAFQGTAINGALNLPESLETIDKNAFNGCKSLSGNLVFGRSIETIGDSAFRDCSGFNGNLNFPEILTDEYALIINDYAFCGCTGFTGNLALPKNVIVKQYAFRDCSGFNGQLSLPSTLTVINEGVFYGCSGFTGEIPLHDVTTVDKYAFYDCQSFTGSIDLNKVSSVSDYSFYNCKGLDGQLIKSGGLSTAKQYAFYGCSNLKGELNCESFTSIEKYAFYGCSGLTGPMHFKDTLTDVEEYAFAGCSGFSNHLSFKVKGIGNLNIEQRAFQDCTGFKDGRLTFTLTQEEKHTDFSSDAFYYYRYDYFLKIGNEAFKNTKFKDIYYLGRFEPDCDYDIGISKIKGIHTSSNYANKTFCNYPLHSNKLSGGAIAGIVIACVVVVAAIVILIVWLILRNKRNKDKSEAEVEMNQDP